MLIEVLEIEDIAMETGVERIWQLLDDAYEKMAHEKLEGVWHKWERAHRLPGQLMADCCTHA